MVKRPGWRKEPARHSLASRGMHTDRKPPHMTKEEGREYLRRMRHIPRAGQGPEHISDLVEEAIKRAKGGKSPLIMGHAYSKFALETIVWQLKALGLARDDVEYLRALLVELEPLFKANPGVKVVPHEMGEMPDIEMKGAELHRGNISDIIEFTRLTYDIDKVKSKGMGNVHWAPEDIMEAIDRVKPGTKIVNVPVTVEVDWGEVPAELVVEVKWENKGSRLHPAAFKINAIEAGKEFKRVEE